ncbi:MAG: aminoacyl-tRNA hydrolase [Firmicutes bacterium]|nr:aminoacyl-tRNA hydrolase [Bacillota bacterium]
MKKWLIVGLGNPEGKYFETYHNIGFKAVEMLATALGFEWKKKGNQLVAQTASTGLFKKDGNILLLKPLTYMNRSGEAVVALTRKQRIPSDRIIVVYDDLFIDKGKIRIVKGGSSAGHNGIKSINLLLDDTNYIKIKMGIKPEKEPRTKADYVLSKIPTDEKEILTNAMQQAVDAIQDMLNGERFEIVQGKHNTKNISEGNK